MRNFTTQETKELAYVAKLANIQLDHGAKTWQDAIWLAAKFASRRNPSSAVIKEALIEDPESEVRGMISDLMWG